MQTDSRNHMDSFQPDVERRNRAEQTFWSTLGTLYRWRRFIVGVTGGVAVLAVVISLLLSNWYQAETRLLLPARSGTGIASAFLEDLPSAARSFIGGGGGDYLRYLTILSSRTVYENVVDRFNLAEVYETAESETPRADAAEVLQGNVEFVVDDEYEFLSVQVLDTDRQRAADMANFFVEELERINSDLASKSASTFRRYVEERHNEAVVDLDSVLAATRSFQEEYGLLELSTQGEQFLSFLTELRVHALETEAEYETLLSQYGPNNSMVQAARQALRTANRKYEQALEGQEQLLPVPKAQLPAVSLEYVELERERLMLTTLIEYIRPVLEEARFDERRKVEAVQVVDVAVPPAQKAKPRRSVLCIAATLSAFILAVLFVLAYTWWRDHYADFARRLRAAAEDAADAPRETAAHPPEPRKSTAKPFTSS